MCLNYMCGMLPASSLEAESKILETPTGARYTSRMARTQGEPTALDRRAAIRKLFFLPIVVAILFMASCGSHARSIEKRDWKALSQLIHEESNKLQLARGQESEPAGQLLSRMHIDRVNLNDLSELKNTYYSRYVEPKLEDSITEALDRLIEKKTGEVVRLIVHGKPYEPAAVYVITSFDPETYQGQLENTYADDSIHIPEFPESYGNKAVLYDQKEAVTIRLEPQFSLVVHPHYYVGHSGQAKAMDVDDRGSLRLPPDTYEAVVFAIIRQKNISEREYKVLWVVNSL